ncbi:hypothetical protein BDA96_04G133400 [Sorghum bicolor]|uniref:Uncharacterized protein n=1 Tax=Sorghum bicolor TaxID=4558 RepID=A0A921R543_SORBI|nr:hypothetical protein BDA96_04G133400 [Sorghum bicolor]
MKNPSITGCQEKNFTFFCIYVHGLGHYNPVHVYLLYVKDGEPSASMLSLDFR